MVLLLRRWRCAAACLFSVLWWIDDAKLENVPGLGTRAAGGGSWNAGTLLEQKNKKPRCLEAFAVREAVWASLDYVVAEQESAQDRELVRLVSWCAR
jgi:hypothetical protein